MTLTEEEVRRINLIEVLKEEAEEAGISVPDPPEDARHWSEQAIRDYFRSGGKLPAAAGPSPAAAFPPPDPATFQRWFPGLKLSGTAQPEGAAKFRVLCFPNAGNSEDVYTNEGTGPRRAASPLLEWCRAAGAECLAVQLPGRAMRLGEPRLTTCRDVAAALLPVVASRLAEAPYVVVAHSVGCWLAYELLRGAEAAGLPPPRGAFLSAMASPDIPAAARPWRPQRGLDEAGFQDECRGWDVNEVVFSPAMWGTYQPLMRADFTLFDEYEHLHAGSPPFAFPLTTFWGQSDRRIKEHMVQGWRAFTTGPFKCSMVPGNHLWPLEREPKRLWLEAVAAELPALLA